MNVREHPNYSRWAYMKSKCTNPKVFDYKNYGGRGITYHIDFGDFWVFTSYIEGLTNFDYTLTLDREDNDGDYTYGNLRWVGRSEQSRNRRRKAIPKDLIEFIGAMDWMSIGAGVKFIRDAGFTCSSERYKELR